MRGFIATALVAIIVACAYTPTEGKHWWWSKCHKYDPRTHYCCYRFRRYCCKKQHYIHEKPTCQTAATEYYEYKCNCKYYIKCKDWNLIKKMCPYGGGFDPGETPACMEIIGPNKPAFCGNRYLRKGGYRYAQYNIAAYDNTTDPATEIQAPFDTTTPGLKELADNVMNYITWDGTDGFSVGMSPSPMNWLVLDEVDGVTPPAGKKWIFCVNHKCSSMSMSRVWVKHMDVLRFYLITDPVASPPGPP